MSPGDAGLRVPGPHFMWMAILILAARYGAKGLLFSLPVAWGTLVVVARFTGEVSALTARFEGAADLVGLITAVLVGWVAGEHGRRRAELGAKLEAARARAGSDQSAVRELQDALLGLRARADRLEFSLTFLRYAAERLEGMDPLAAAQAALEISMARLGARAGVVQLFDRHAPSTIAWVGPWAAGNGAAPDLSGDKTVATALRTRRGSRAIDLPDASPTDADLATSLLDGQGHPFGILAVRGVPFAGASMSTLKDLAVVGAWLASAVVRSACTAATGDGDSDQDQQRAEPYVEIRCLPEPDIESALQTNR